MSKETKTIIGTIEGFAFVDQGKKKDGTPWARYKGLISGEKFQTFDEEYAKNGGVKKRFLYSEEPQEFTNKEGELIQYTRRTLFPFETAKDHEDSFEEAQKEIPIIEDEDPRRYEEDDPGFGATKEEIDAFKGEGTILEKIHKTLLEILTVLEDK